jgi:Ser/Thr protein kinase RdoA (MazF antagonist)
MPFLARALDPLEVHHQLQHYCPRLTNHQIHLCAIRVTRYKPARRCLIEYDLEVQQPLQKITLVGKVRSRGLDQSSYHLLQSLWNAGFAANSEDGISVPEPVGVIPEFQMWLQRKVPGAVATKLLAKWGGVALARRIAEAAHKLHQAGIPTHRRHTIADELRILHERLPLVAQMKPLCTQRLEKILDACDRLGSATPEPSPRGIHRDFYPDQVIVDGSRLYLLDFDLYCEGDPALDIGNFLGHITEQSLRTLGDRDALEDREKALTERFLQLSNDATQAAVSAYTTLTLVRHIYLSTQFLERRQFTETLLELCEQRLGIAERTLAGKPS